jgi:hypothetical protein
MGIAGIVGFKKYQLGDTPQETISKEQLLLDKLVACVVLNINQ